MLHTAAPAVPCARTLRAQNVTNTRELARRQPQASLGCYLVDAVRSRQILAPSPPPHRAGWLRRRSDSTSGNQRQRDRLVAQLSISDEQSQPARWSGLASSPLDAPILAIAIPALGSILLDAVMLLVDTGAFQPYKMAWLYHEATAHIRQQMEQNGRIIRLNSMLCA